MFFLILVQNLLPGLEEDVETDPVLADPPPVLCLAPVLPAVLYQHGGDQEPNLKQQASTEGLNKMWNEPFCIFNSIQKYFKIIFCKEQPICKSPWQELILLNLSKEWKH